MSLRAADLGFCGAATSLLMPETRRGARRATPRNDICAMVNILMKTSLTHLRGRV
jgi:hypothetical protein